MAGPIFAVIVCATALTVGSFPARSAQTIPVAGLDQQAMTREGCIANGAAGRGRCPRTPTSGAAGLDEQCEDAINLQQRTCMLEALEAQHSKAPHPEALASEPLPPTTERPR
jgi:hypothetical protein